MAEKKTTAAKRQSKPKKKATAAKAKETEVVANEESAPAEVVENANAEVQPVTDAEVAAGEVVEGTPEGGGAEAEKEEEINYSVSPGLSERFARLKISVAVTSYQSGLMYLLGRNVEGGIHIHQIGLPRPMGVCIDPPLPGEKHSMSVAAPRFTLMSGHNILRFENVLVGDQRANEVFDSCYVPRRINLTGHLDAHDVGVSSDGTPIFVNTRFNCLAEPSDKHSFKEVWRPSFVSALVDEDRCHLNGLAMEEGRPKYVTAVSRSDTIDGWRDRRANGGILIDIDTNRVVCTGLSMPHSPRIQNGKLWLLNSGTGYLGTIEFEDEEKQKGQFVPQVFCPGFLRGLSFYGNLAFVGLSKPRYQRFEGLDLDDKLRETDSEPWCGVQIIDLTRKTCVDWFRIDGKIAELYDVEVIHGTTLPLALTPDSPDASALVTFEGMPVGDAVPADQQQQQQPQQIQQS